MSDVEDSKLDSNESSNQTSADSPKSDTNIPTPAGELDNKRDPDDAKKEEEKNKMEVKPRLRYTKEQLLALRESPLVKKPDALPSISEWFGEPAKKEKKVGADGALETEKSKNNNTLGSELNKSKDDSLGILKSPLIGISKSPNGSAPTSPKPQDKIVLGPPKMNFASSSVGGLKIVEEKSAPPRTVRSDGMRQRQGEDISYVRSGKDYEPRAPRGPSGGRGFVGREALREQRSLTEKVTKESTGPTHGAHSRGFGNIRSHETSRSNRREGIGGKEHSGRNSSRYQYVEDRSETPEWMNYNPQTDEDTKHIDNGEASDKSMFDLQAWKVQMKEKDRERERNEKEKTKERRETTEKGRARSISRADSSISWRPGNKTMTTEEADDASNNKAAEIVEIVQNGSKEKNPDDSSPSLNLADVDQLFGPGGMDLNVKEHSGSSAFNKFLFQHELAMTEDNIPKTGTGSHIETVSREQGTSRFARFFSHNTEENPQENDHIERPPTFQVSPQNPQVSTELLKPGPISLDTLFQSQVATPSTTASISPRIIPNEGIRILPGMLTEEEVLQTLGAKPSSKPETKERSSEDEAAMFKIYAALEKGPSSSDLPSQLSHNVSVSSSHQPVQFHHSAITNSGLPFNDPSIISAQKPASINKTNQPPPPPKIDISSSNRYLGISELTPNDSVKKINMLFGGNVPTSVYRQLSSRSDNGSRESSTASSPALKFNPKPNISNFPHSPQSSANIPDLHAPVYKSPSPRSPILPQQSHTPSQYNIVPPYSNGPNIPQHSHNRQEFPPPVGRNIPVDQLFSMVPQPPRNVIHPQFQQPPMTSSVPPQMPFGYQHDRYPQQLQFSGPPPIPPQHLSVHHHHPGLLPPGTEALFANMHGYAQFIPNLVNNAIAPNTIPGIPNNANMQQRGMMTLEEIERSRLGSR